MIPCICIDDTDKPSQIPKSKWVKEGKKYHVVYTVWSLTSKKLGVYLDEISLDETCLPYEYFSIDRFAFNIEDIDKLEKLIQDCSESDFSMDELMGELNTL